MHQSINIESLTSEHAKRLEPHRDQFRAVGDEAAAALDGMFGDFVRDREAQRQHQAKYYAFIQEARRVSDAQDSGSRANREAILAHFMQPTSVPATREPSRLAIETTVRPVRDLTVGDVRLLEEDRALHFVVPPYPEVWTKTGDSDPSAHDAGLTLPLRAWAEPTDGTFGFEAEVTGTVTGRSQNCGAALYFWFVPQFTPGFAQIRPIVDYSWAWLDLSFTSLENTSAGFGILVWSWRTGGGDFALELDYRYPAWDDWCSAAYFDTHNSPSWVGTEWDYDYAFRPNESPYFAVRPNRIYKAAIWCFGHCSSYSPENRPGGAIARIHAKMPWAVVGYQ